MNFQEALAAFQADRAHAESLGIIFPDAVAYVPDEFRYNVEMAELAFDAQPGLITSPNSAVPAILTTLIDPEVYQILFSPNKATKIIGEVRKGTWLDDTAMFPVVEHTGEVSSYGDFNNNGRAGANTAWPQRQSYLYQTIKIYGDKELERAGLARINWVSELDQSAATQFNKFQNLTYFRGVAGLQNYGLLNDPGLSPFLAPTTKAAGNSNTWFFNGGPNATANEVYNDIVALFGQLVAQSGGIIEAEDAMVLAMSPGSAVALTFTNTFNVNVHDLLKKNYPNMRIETAVQYGALSASNPQGSAGGNIVQLIAERAEGQKTGYAAYNEKMRAHPTIRELSAYRQKMTAGTWGTVLRMPVNLAQMIGV